MSVYRVVNAAWQLGGDEHLIRSQAKGADVLVVVEARDHDNDPVPVGRILGSDFRVFQDRRDGARAGTAIAVRRKRAGGQVKARRVHNATHGAASRLLRISVKGRKVQARYLRTVRLRDEHGPLTLGGVHLPLESTTQQDDALEVVSKWWRRTRNRRLLMGDANRSHDSLRQALSAPHSAGRDVMAVIWSGDWPRVTTGHHKAQGSDHEVVDLRTHLPSH